MRALAVKAEFADIENIKTLMMSKDELVVEMRRLLKAKVCYYSHRLRPTAAIVAAAAAVKRLKVCISLHRNSASQLRDVTCHMGSHSVTCHLTQVNAPRLNPSQ